MHNFQKLLSQKRIPSFKKIFFKFLTSVPKQPKTTPFIRTQKEEEEKSQLHHLEKKKKGSSTKQS